MESPFAIGFYVLSYFKLNSSTIINVLQLLENEAEDLPVDSITLDFIAPLIHQIYTKQNVFIRCSSLRIISFFEINSPTSIIEKYQFDKLVCMSLEQKDPDPPLKIDEEKVVSFRIVLLLIKMRHIMPVSIVRSLVSLYYIPKHNYGGLIVSYLCQAILECDDFPDVPEVSQVLTDYLIETGDQKVIDLLGYIFEKQYIFMNYNYFTSKILSSLSGAFNQIVNLDQASQIVIKLLGTWPGLFCFGVKYNSILNLVKTLPHFQSTIISIFTKLLFLNSPKMSSMNGYTGFLLFYLLKNNLVDLLSGIVSTNSESMKFLDDLLFYTSHYKNTSIITNDNINGFFNKSQILINNNNNMLYYDDCSSLTQIPSASSSLLRISQCLPSFQSLSSTNSSYSLGQLSIPSANSSANSGSVASFPSSSSSPLDQFSLQNLTNSDEINWKKVHVFLTVILAHNSSEAQSQQAQQLYFKIFNYFCSRQVSDFPKNQYIIISECVFALIDLLLPKEKSFEYKSSFLFESKDFILAIINCLNIIVTPNLELDDHHPVWSIIESFCKLMIDPIGIHIFAQQKMPNLLLDIGKKFSPTKSVERLLQMVKFYPESGFSTFFFSLFIYSNSPEVVRIALNELRRKCKNTPNFYKNCLETTLLQFIRQSNNNMAINLLCEMILESEECLSIVARDWSLHQIIKNYSREMYCVLLRHFEHPSKLSDSEFNSLVDNEIDYWMKTGIYEYVLNFDKASKMTFERKKEAVPSAVIVDGHALIPPHIFGQISQHPEGLKKLSNHVQTLLDILKKLPENSSIKKKRAALFALGHFCSVQEASKPEIIQAMIDSALKSESCILIGTLIDSLSLVVNDSSTNQILKKNGFTFFEFGDHICVVPLLPERILEDSSSCLSCEVVNDDWEEKLVDLEIPSQIAMQLPLLLNPIHQTASTQLLYKSANGDKSASLNEPILTTENVNYAHRLISLCTFIPTARKYIFDLFRSTPLLMPSKDECVNQMRLAECLARVEEAANASQMMLASSGFSDVKIVRMSANEIKAKKQTAVPEVYLNDEELVRVAGVSSREQFYFLSTEQQAAIRQSLM